MAAPSPSDFPPGYLEQYSGGQLLGTSIAFTILGCAFVALRFYTRFSFKAKLGWDDYLLGPALVANIVLQTADIVLVTDGGVGHHIEYWEINDPSTIKNWAKALLAVELTYLFAVCMGKLTILAIYARIFTSKPMLYTTYALVGIVVAAWFGSSIAAIFQATPVGCQWDPNATNCQTIDILAFFRYLSLPSILTDVIMLFLPMPMVWQLKLSRSQKFGLTSVFLTGSIGLIASCVRFAIFFQADALEDGTWKSAFLNIWTVTEPGTYLIASCLPALRPILLSTARKLHLIPPTTSNRGRNYGSSNKLYGNGSRLGTLDAKGRGMRSGMLDGAGLETGLRVFERIPEDGESSVGTSDERGLISRDGKAVPSEKRRPSTGRTKSGIEIRQDVNIVFSDRELDKASYALDAGRFDGPRR